MLIFTSQDQQPPKTVDAEKWLAELTESLRDLNDGAITIVNNPKFNHGAAIDGVQLKSKEKRIRQAPLPEVAAAVTSKTVAKPANSSASKKRSIEETHAIAIDSVKDKEV